MHHLQEGVKKMCELVGEICQGQGNRENLARWSAWRSR